MASVNCPACGERVKLRDDVKKLRCRECGKLFDPDEVEEEEEAPRRSKHVRPAAKSRTKIAAITVGSVLALALVVLAVILIVRGKGGKDGESPADPAKVTPENFQLVKPGMDLAEAEGILGGSRSSSEEDMRNAFRKTGDGMEGEITAAMEVGFSRFGEGAEWRRWEGKDFEVWVAFAQTKEGKRAAFSTGLQKTGGAYKPHRGFFTWGDPNFGHDLDEMNAQRKKEDAVRNDPKWVRGAQAQALVAGEWRNEGADGLIFAADGKLTEDNPVSMMANQQRPPTYRVLDDKRLAITYPPPPPPPPPPPGFPPSPFKFEAVTRTYEYFVNQEELALIEVTPHAHISSLALRTFYRMPPRPGGAADVKLIAPLVADIKGNDATKRQVAFYKLKRFGKGAATALPALAELLRGRDDRLAEQAADAIGDMREAGSPAVPELAAVLRDPNSNRCLPVVLALGRIGPAAKQAIPALRALAQMTKNAHLRNEAEAVIRNIEGKRP